MSQAGPIPQSDQLLFSVTSSNLPATGAWPSYLPANQPLSRIGSATSELVNGVKWEKNSNATGDGFHFANYPQPTTLSFNGGTIVASVRPQRNGISEPYVCVVSVLLGQFELCVANDTGRISIGRGGVDAPNIDTGVNLANDQASILSVVVQPTGEIALYVNGIQAWSTAAAYPFSPTLTAQTWYATDVNVGKGWNADTWSSFNGDIGDVFVYKIALDDSDRQTLEAGIAAHFGITVPVYAPISGTVTLRDGVTPLAGATVTASGAGSTFTATSSADGSYALSALVNENYAVSATMDGLSESPAQNVSLGTTAVTGIRFSLSPFCGMMGDSNVSVTVDPTVPLTNYWSGGEWNTNGNFEGWTTTQVGGATVAGGVLTGTASDYDPQVIVANLTNGPDLDLAFFDYLDLRLQVPAGFTGDIPVCFGTTNTPGIDPSRVAIINHTNIPSDGAFHVYRLFFGPHVYWRGNLSDLRIDPLGCSATVGQSFAIDYVRLGDLAGDVYYPSYVTGQVPSPGANDPNGYPTLDMSSKHFRFCWDVSISSNSYWTADMPHGTLRNMEEVWKSHVLRLGFLEPSRPGGSPWPYTGTKYKVNVTTWYGGYWTGEDGNGVPWVNITPDGLRVNPPTWVPPHEFTHACQEAANTNGTTLDGQFWENNANYGREQWLYFYPWNTNQSGLDPGYANMSHFWIGHGRDYYLCWPIWLYLDENPDHLPGLGSTFGNFFSAQVWKAARPGEYLWDTIARLDPAVSVQDLIGYMARRNVEWDYSHRTAMNAAANAGDTEQNQRWAYAELQQRPDDPSWWRTPIEFAPQQSGYKIIKLVPQGDGAGRVVTVNFHGLPDSSRGAGWRVSFVVVSDSGTVRYSDLWAAGTNSVTLANDENTVYLTVAGTPATFLPESIDDAVQPYQSSPAKERFPYEMQITGATPYESTNNTAGLIQVPNGGGWRSASATVDATAYVGPNACVLGTAKVRGNARILDYAVVEGNAIVTNNAVVSGHALVRNSAVVKDDAKVRDYAMVVDNSVVSGHARVLQHALITGGSAITDWATVKGSASTWQDTSVATGPQAWNDAVLDGDFATAQSVSNGFQFGFEEYNAGPLLWITNRTAPRRLYAAYEFNTPQDSLAKDLLGVTDGYLEGSPDWVNSDGQRSGFLTFNGVNQFVSLDRSVSDLNEITITAWVKWSGGAPNQPVWYFSSATTNCMFFTPDDGSGQAKFSIVKNSVTQSLAWTNALPVGVWTQVTLSLSNGVAGRLYINGTNVATGAITFTPDQLNAPNVNTVAQQNYLARGAGTSLPFFQGALDSVRIYTGPLTDAEIGAMQVPPTVAGTGTLYVDLRATNAAAGAQTLFNIWTNLGSLGNFTLAGSPAYSTNVAGTGIPGILFDGTTARYRSAVVNSADLTGHSDRSIEVWAYNPALADQETLVSLGDRSGTRKDCALNFGSSATQGAATHLNDDTPWGAMGSPAANGWHHLVYTYDGNLTVKIYVDGLLWFTDALGNLLVTPTTDPINIGCQRATPGVNGTPGQFFSGYINSVRVWGGVLSADQIAANYLFGPWKLPSAPKAIAFAPLANVTVNAGVTLTLTNIATDPNLPPLPVSFSLLSGPAGAAINPDTGIFTWRPTVAQASSTNLIILRAANNASPALTATQNFQAVVNPLNSPVASALFTTNDQLSLTVSGDAGPDYFIEASTNLIQWQPIYTNLSPTLPFNWTDPAVTNFSSRFYRIILGP